jgi:hypothetical protein
MPKKGSVAEPGLVGVAPGSGRDQDAAGLGLPPGIDDGAAFAADEFVVPHPRFGIDWLAYGAKQAEGSQVMLLRPLDAPFHKRANGGGRGVENRHAIFLDDAPEAVRLREVGRAFIHQTRRAVRQRPIDHVAVARDPTDVRGAPERVLIAQVEDVFGGELGIEQIAARGMEDAFRFAGRAAGVENEQGRFAVHLLRRAMRIDGLQLAMPPQVAAFLELHFVVGAAEHDDLLDGLREQFAVGILERERFVHVLLERHDGAAPEATVGREDQLGLRVADAVGDGLGAETAEDDRVHRAEAGAGEHGNGGLGHHGQVDQDAVAGLDAVAFEDIAEPADLVMKLFVGEGALFARLAGGCGLPLPDQGGLVGARGVQMPVETIVTDIELAADEPLGVRLVPFQHPGPALGPDQFRFGLPAPEFLRGLDGFTIQLAILGKGFEMGAPGERFGRREDTRLLQDGLNVCGDIVGGHINQRFLPAL